MKYRKDEYIVINQNLDRISMMYSFLYTISQKPIYRVSRREYHKLSEHINTLNIVKDYANILVDKHNPIGEIPYLDDLIDKNDDYIIKKKKRLI